MQVRQKWYTVLAGMLALGMVHTAQAADKTECQAREYQTESLSYTIKAPANVDLGALFKQKSETLQQIAKKHNARNFKIVMQNISIDKGDKVSGKSSRSVTMSFFLEHDPDYQLVSFFKETGAEDFSFSIENACH